MLVLIRHGESEGNAENRMCGQINYDLTPLGIQQSHEAGQTLAPYRFDLVISSDLERARKTAELLLKNSHHGMSDITLLEELRERSGGVYEGMTYEEIRSITSPKQYKLWQRDYFEAPPLGESMQDVSERVVPILETHVYPAMQENQNILVISHATVMKTIIGDLKQMDESEVPGLRIENAIPYFFYGLPPR